MARLQRHNRSDQHARARGNENDQCFPRRVNVTRQVSQSWQATRQQDLYPGQQNCCPGNDSRIPACFMPAIEPRDTGSAKNDCGSSRSPWVGCMNHGY